MIRKERCGKKMSENRRYEIKIKAKKRLCFWDRV